MEPQPLQPLEYYGSKPKDPRLPGIAKTVAIIGIMLGGSNAADLCRNIFDALTTRSNSTHLFVLFGFDILLPGVLTIALLVGSIAVLESKQYGRKLLLVYAPVNFIYGIAIAIMTKMSP